ncbi:MAG: manganese efflux pump MntP family protein [Pseudomonadota bacterium]
MDAFAVAIATGVMLKTVNTRQTFRLAWHFGLFQALMPIIGWSAGLTIRTVVEHFAHWAAFGLLFLIGAHMIHSAMSKDDDDRDSCDPTRGLTMVMLSVATSIDALAVGLTLSMLNVSIWTPALIIGLVAGGFTVAGMHLGKALSRAAHFSRWAEALGGVVLIAIGINILREHGVF